LTVPGVPALALEWGPAGTWAGATATFLAALIALLASLGRFDRFRAPRLQVTFEQTEPWCRFGEHPVDGTVLWVRVGVENLGRAGARLRRSAARDQHRRHAATRHRPDPVAVGRCAAVHGVRPDRRAPSATRVPQRHLSARGVALADREAAKRNAVV
jgi:hypothetical protein